MTGSFRSQNAEFLDERLPNSRLRIIDAGNFVSEEAPAEYASIISRIADVKGLTDMKRLLITLLAIAALGGGAAVALADSTPVGPLPAGPAATIDVQHGELLALALPQRSAGRVWRLARPFDANVLRQVSESSVGGSIVLVFRAKSAGHTTVSIALTKDDASAKALESRRFQIHVR